MLRIQRKRKAYNKPSNDKNMKGNVCMFYMQEITETERKGKIKIEREQKGVRVIKKTKWVKRG